MNITDLAQSYLESVIPPEHQTIHERLTAWGRWARSRPHQGHVASLEGRFRAPRGCEVEWEQAIPLPAPLPPPSDPEALAIELIWRFIPDRHGKALKLIYVRRYSELDCRRRLAVNVTVWPVFIYRARQITLNLLTRHKTFDKRAVQLQFVQGA